MPAGAGTVLIVSHTRDDDHAARVSRELARRGVECVRLDTDRYPEEVGFSIATSARGAETVVHLPGRTVRGAEVASILYRHRSLPQASQIADPDARAMAERELLALIDGALLSLPAFWVNHPYANRLASHKPLQLTLAADAGFRLPPTRITRDPAAVRQAYAEWEGAMVAKLVGGQVIEPAGETPYAIYTTRVGVAELDDEAGIAAAPAIYQRQVPKAADVRVTVVGEKAFACQIKAPQDGSGEVDWRRGGTAGARALPYTLDAADATRCRRLARRLGLEVAGIDLILTPESELVFLEINAAGQWAWVEESTGLPIAAAIAERLLEGRG